MLSIRKRRSIEQQLQSNPAASNRAIGREMRVDHKTVATIRAALTGGENSPPKAARAGRESGASKKAVQTGAPDANASPDKPATDPPTCTKMHVDPRAILESIAADKHQPATARVAAAKALLALAKPTVEAKAAEAVDQVTARALQLIEGGKRS